MARTQKTVAVSQIPTIVDDPARGVISLVGDHGGLSLITGPINSSSLVMGSLAIETEHGVVYLDPNSETTISEDDGRTLDQRVEGSLFAINDILTIHLAERFGWHASTQEHYDALNDLTNRVAEGMDDLLAQFPAADGEPR